MNSAKETIIHLKFDLLKKLKFYLIIISIDNENFNKLKKLKYYLFTISINFGIGFENQIS